MLFVKSALVYLALASISLAAEPVKLRTLTGKLYEGDLTAISEKEVALFAKEGPAIIAIADVLDIAFPTGNVSLADLKYTDLQLTDGSLLHCERVAIKGAQVEAKMISGQEVKLPLKVVSYLLNEAQDAKNREEWSSLLTKRGNRDLLAAKDKEGKVNPIDGTFGDGDATGETIAFESSAGARLALKQARIHAIAFLRQGGGETPPALCKVHDSYRDQLVAARLTLADDKLSLVTVSGIQVDYSRQLLTRLDFSQGKLAYLSDLVPIKVVETSNVEDVEHYRRDKNLEDGPIRLVVKNDSKAEPRSFAKGLALHASTELVYDIGGQYKEFKAILGVDPGVGGESHVRITIDGDGRELFTGEIARRDSAKALTCDVQNVRQLRIVLRPVGLLDLGNHASLADAKVTK